MTGIIALLTLKRLFRGKAVWISILIAGLPIAYAVARRSGGPAGLVADVLVFETLVLAILPAMFVGASVSEDIEDKTTAYLWSRPIPRWAVLAGKLLALAPLIAAIITGSWIAAIVVGTGAPPTTLSIVALAAGTVVVCFAATAIATLVPRSGMALTIGYMLFFDLPVGLMPLSLAKLSITHQMRAFSDQLPGGFDMSSNPSSGAIGLVVLAVVWLAVAIWRIRRLEA